jgi:excisionase family DNA binding protein
VGSGKKALVPPVKALMEELTVSVDETAVLLGLSRGHTYDAVKDGQIPSIRIGRTIRVPTAALRAMLQIGEVRASTAAE